MTAQPPNFKYESRETIVSFVTGSGVVALLQANKQYAEKLVSGDSAWRTWMNIVKREVGAAAFRAMTGT